MIEPADVAMTATAVLSFVAPAVSDLGKRVLDDVESTVSSKVVDVGRRLVRLLVGRSGEAPVQGHPDIRSALERRIERLAEKPQDVILQAQVETAVEDLLLTDERLRAAVEALMEDCKAGPETRPTSAVVVGRDNIGTIVNGSGNSVHAWTPRV